jgi:thiamine biosynthesis lipoprotein ApbE
MSTRPATAARQSSAGSHAVTRGEALHATTRGEALHAMTRWEELHATTRGEALHPVTRGEALHAVTRWEALGTSAVLALTRAGALPAARAIVERELDLIDRACSRFRTDSDLSRVNARAGHTVKVDPLLIEALEVALRAAQLTGGDVDPTVGVALELAGYDRDWRLLEPVPANGRVDRAPHDPVVRTPRVRAHVRAGWQAIRLNRALATVAIPRGVKLDLGATAKAWAADRASRAVHEATGAGALLSLGGDIATAGAPPAGGWRVHVTDDHRAGPDAPGQRIAIQSGGLATSSTAVRRWSHRGQTMHHLIDPATGAPARGPWRTVSVAAIDCTDANIASTAALVRGASAPRWLRELNLPARLVSNAGEVLTVGSWPAEAQAIEEQLDQAQPGDPEPTASELDEVWPADAHRSAA